MKNPNPYRHIEGSATNPSPAFRAYMDNAIKALTAIKGVAAPEVSNAFIAWLASEFTACDGNHAEPRCFDAECWHGDAVQAVSNA